MARASARHRSVALLALALTISCGGGKSSSSKNPPPTGTVSYKYDPAGRLLSAQASGADLYSYAYDQASNLTSMTAAGKRTDFTYGKTNAISTSSAGGQPPAYDANGNPTSLDGNRYAWDAANRLIRVVAGSAESDFTYDALGRIGRIVEKRDGTMFADHSYLWCGGARCLERDNTMPGSPVSKQYFGGGVVIGGKPYHYVSDRLGSVKLLVDATGAVRARYSYSPFGLRTKVSGDVDSDIGYAGYFHHEPSGLDLALYRAYDPRHGRWLNRDPIGVRGGLNLYAYAQNNPMTWRDPSGLRPTGPGSAPGGRGGIFLPNGINVDAVMRDVNRATNNQVMEMQINDSPYGTPGSGFWRRLENGMIIWQDDGPPVNMNGVKEADSLSTPCSSPPPKAGSASPGPTDPTPAPDSTDFGAMGAAAGAALGEAAAAANAPSDPSASGP